MSMDFVYDLTEKLQEQKIDHLLITVRKGRKKDTADVFYSLEGEESTTTLCRVLSEILPILEKEELERQDNANENTEEKPEAGKPPKKPRGRPRKKRDDDDDNKK